MRIFYCFKVKNYYTSIYKDRGYKLYKLLEEIYYGRLYDEELLYNYYEQIVEFFDDINIISDNLYKKLSNNINYSRNENIHIICNNFEYTKLVVGIDTIKVKSNLKNPSILKELDDIEDLFICDFRNNCYFWSKSDCQNEKKLVK